MKILVLNGPNINLLGIREKEMYGHDDYVALCQYIQSTAHELGITVDVQQTNSEGEMVTLIQEALDVYDGLVINPSAYACYSVAILDALKGVGLPSVEVHLTNVYKRETYRQHLVTAAGSVGPICGLGFQGYGLALRYLVDYIAAR